MDAQGAAVSKGPGIPRNVWVLGIVSMFMDTSSEMIHALLPVLLVGTLGVTAFSLGIIEGIAEGLALAAKAGADVQRVSAEPQKMIQHPRDLVAREQDLLPIDVFRFAGNN